MIAGPTNYADFLDTQNQYGTQVAPVAGTVIADSGALPAGLYDVRVETSYGGVADVIDNMELWVNARKIVTLTVIPTANALPFVQQVPAVRVEPNQRIQVKNIATGGAGSVFRAVIRATPLTTLSIA